MANDTDPPRKSLFVAFDPESAAIARELVTALLAARGSDRAVSSDDPPLLAADPQSDAFDHLLDHCQALIVVFVDSRQKTEGGLAAPLLNSLTEIIAKALANDRLAVVPLLIGDAEMPLAADLPPELAAFVQLPPVRLDDPQGPEALAHLLRAVERAVQVEAMLREARTALAEGQPDVAIRRMDELLSEIPGERRAQQLKAEAVERGLTTPPPLVADENVQFTVFRRSAIKPERWYPLLVFAHLSERRADAPPDEADPIAEVQAQAAQVLGEDAGAFRSSTEDAGHPVIREGELRVVPRVEGVTFNPPERRFLWTENVHREDFRMRAEAALVGRTARGVVTVFAGNLILADIQIGIQVKAEAVDGPPEPSHARAYRRIFASYSHRDSSIVEEFEAHAAATGDRYVRDVITLRAGEEWDQRLLDLIKQADVFQLFWSWNALASPLVREEWQHALALNRPHFVRPVYWEEPLPAGPGLPPETLRRLHFQRVYPRSRGQGTPDVVPTKHVPPIEASTQAGSGAPGTDAIRLPPQAREPLPAMRSTMRLIQYGSAVAACVLAVGLYATLNNNPAFIDPEAQQAELPSQAPTPADAGSGSSTPAETAAAAKPAPGDSEAARRQEQQRRDLIVKQEQARAAEMARARDLERERELQRRHESQLAAERQRELQKSAAERPRPPIPDSARPDPPVGGSPVPAPPQSAAPSGQSATSSIEATLRQYEAAWATQDLAALRRIWLIPTAQVSAVNDTFRDARAIHVSVRVINVSLTSDSRAIVRAEERMEIIGSRGGRRTSEKAYAFHMERRGSSWIIIAKAG